MGEVVDSEDTIILEDVPIVTPNKDVVASELSFQVGRANYVHYVVYIVE